MVASWIGRNNGENKQTSDITITGPKSVRATEHIFALLSASALSSILHALYAQGEVIRAVVTKQSSITVKLLPVFAVSLFHFISCTLQCPTWSQYQSYKANMSDTSQKYCIGFARRLYGLLFVSHTANVELIWVATVPRSIISKV